MAVVLICACFSLSGPWYSVKEVYALNSTVEVSKETVFHLYKGIDMHWTYELDNNGEIFEKNHTKVSWNDSKMIELVRVFHLCGPVLIAAVVLDFIGIILIIAVRFLNATENTYDDGFIAHCILFHRRWILLFCGFLVTSILLNTISTFLFLATPQAFRHDYAAVTGEACSVGPCHSWTGHNPKPHIFRNWGPSYGWYAI